MSRFAQILIAALALGAGCAHTRTTDDGTEKEKQKDERKQSAAPQTRENARRAPDPHPGDADAVPVAAAPAALLSPGAARKIREKLVAGGFLADDAADSDAAMRDGLRRFQSGNDLPATGVADHETVKRLGLEPDTTFRQGTVKD